MFVPQAAAQPSRVTSEPWRAAGATAGANVIVRHGAEGRARLSIQDSGRLSTRTRPARIRPRRSRPHTVDASTSEYVVPRAAPGGGRPQFADDRLAMAARPIARHGAFEIEAKNEPWHCASTASNRSAWRSRRAGRQEEAGKYGCGAPRRALAPRVFNRARSDERSQPAPSRG